MAQSPTESPRRSRSRAAGPTIGVAGTEVERGPIGISGVEVDRGRIGISGLANLAGVTGRKLVLLPADDPHAAGDTLRNRAGLRVQLAAESGAAAPDPGAARLMPRLGVALVNADPDQIAALATARAHDPAVQAEPEDEYILYAVGRGQDWLAGYRDAVDHIAERMLDEETEADAEGARAAAIADSAAATWGVLATEALASPLNGSGVGLAVLDTGLDMGHPDFPAIADHASFVPAEATAEDLNGHGTHCAGIAVGGGAPHGTSTRYGMAGQARLFVAKVLNSRGLGEEGWILDGLEWALAQGCRVASLSLGAQAPHSPLFEQVGMRARAGNMLVVAAAGNDSNRPFSILPVGYPANCDSILAVGALDAALRVARFSNRGTRGGGQIDFVGPGVGVLSAVPRPRLYQQLSGTSMATPFVAGIAAMVAQANPSAGPDQIVRLMRAKARRLPGLPQADVGGGLARAP